MLTAKHLVNDLNAKLAAGRSVLFAGQPVIRALSDGGEASVMLADGTVRSIWLNTMYQLLSQASRTGGRVDLTGREAVLLRVITRRVGELKGLGFRLIPDRYFDFVRRLAAGESYHNVRSSYVQLIRESNPLRNHEQQQ